MTEKTDQPIDFGQYLQSRRRAEGISLEEVARRTKVSMTCLRQIESEDWANLPSPTFVKGFVKAYADAVGADPGEALDRYAAYCAVQQELSAPQPPVTGSTGFGKRLALALVLLVLLIGGTILIMQRISTEAEPVNAEDALPAAQRSASDGERAAATATDAPSAPKPAAEPPPPAAAGETPAAPEPPAVVAPPATVATPPDPVQPVSEAPPATTGSAAETLPSAAAPAAETVAPPAPAADMPAEPEAAAAAAETPSPTKVLRISVVETSWLSVAGDGNPPREAILAPGDSITVEARNHFALVIGNAGGVRLELDGQPVPLSGRSGQVVRLRLPRE
ncbi:helix-turn-helix domain-containing protein [Desulfatitalea alkaliphila]|uniref:Helix-turn-helix domain-containing protein n=1 Tax=Desulfatitalea alkaliphila TaxID=2929485 RepID=A0AA41R3A4_9BACT|nr:helix-turn-helix domain-containing protein [Desulfatitalea alkaliphila]MCJ8499976.1 helix-turn-helix domain-containing protein [Desulfatitalea alkaliphila]